MTLQDAARVLRRAETDLQVHALDLVLRAKRALARGADPEAVAAHVLAALGDAEALLRSRSADMPHPPEAP